MYELKKSDSPLINSLWHAIAKQDGIYSDAANEYWGLGFTRRTDGTFAAELIGPSLEHRTLRGYKGEEYWGVELAAHVTMQGVDKNSALGALRQLSVTGNQFAIGGSTYAIPAYEELEALVDDLARQGIIYSDERIYRSLMGNDEGLSERSRQRRFRSVTGLSKKQIAQIKRARYAFYLLQQGSAPAAVAHQTGYADQAHMTRALKVLRGETPARVIATHLKDS